MTTAADVVAHARSRPARLGSTRLVCIDGPAGSGKTTLASRVAELAGASVVHLDDLYPGWEGLFEVDRIVLDLLGPLAEGRSGRYRRFDWTSYEFAESRVVEPAALLVLEGVGSGNQGWRDLVGTLVWVEAPEAVRFERGLARDGESVRDRWVQWMHDEARLFAQQRTRAAADLVMTTG